MSSQKQPATVVGDASAGSAFSGIDRLGLLKVESLSLEFALPEPGTISTAIVHFRTEESTSGDGEAVPSNEQSFEFLLAGPENLVAVRADLEGRRFSALFIERSSEEQAQEAASGAEVSRYVPLHEEWLILEDKDEEAVAYLTTEEDGPIAEVAELRYSSASSLLLREEKEAGPNDSQ